jgi:hypothetical protein
MTLNQTIKRIEAIALAHKQINHFYYGNLAEWLAQPTGKVKYPACFAEHNSSNISTAGKFLTHNFRLYFLDLVNVVNEAEANDQEVLSDMMSVAGDINALFQDYAYNDTWYIAGVGPITLYSEKLTDYVAGVSVDLPVQTFYLTDACAVPASALPSDSVVIVQTGNDWQWVHYTLPADSNVVTIASVAGKTVQGIFRDDMPQQLVASAPGVDKQYTFVAATGTFTWNASNVLFAGTVITVICK